MSRLTRAAPHPAHSYALGEFRRIEAYADPSKGFLVMPPDFPAHLLPVLSSLEPLLRSTIEAGLRAGGATSYATSLGVSVEDSA